MDRQYENRRMAWIVTEHDPKKMRLRFTAFSVRAAAHGYADSLPKNSAEQLASGSYVMTRVHEVPWPNDGTGHPATALVVAFVDWQRQVQVNVFEPQEMPDTTYGRGGDFIPKDVLVVIPEGTCGILTLDGPTEPGLL